MLGDCIVSEQVQSPMQMSDIQQTLENNNFKILSSGGNLVASGMILDTPIGIFIEQLGGAYKVSVGSYKLSLSQVLSDCLTFLFSNAF